MIRALFVALVVVFGTLGCAHARPPLVPVVPAGPPKFDADETIDVTRDWTETPASAVPAEVKLTASDGTGIALTRFDARAVLYGPLAFTELHLTFETPEPGPREGTFSLTLPQGASVSRFAMLVNERWQEGEVVALDKARQVFEEAIHKKVDPALLEKTSSNTFRGRVYPIWGGRKPTEIVLAYTTVDSWPFFRVMLQGLPTLKQLDVQVFSPFRHKAWVLHRENEAPARDFTVLAEDGLSVRGGRFAITSFNSKRQPRVPVDDIAVLIDASASRAGVYAASVDATARIVEDFGLDPMHTHLAVFDQTVVPIASVRDAKAFRPGGATDFVTALRWAANLHARTLVVTDGRGTTGLQALKSLGLDRVDVLVDERGDLDGARALVDCGKQAGRILTSPDHAHAALVSGWGRITRAEIAGAVHVWPSALERTGLPDASARAFVELPDAKTPLEINVDGEPHALPFPPVEAPEAIVERAVVEAQLRELDPKKDREELVRLSVKHRILTSVTSMIVLETEGEYGRYGIPREAMTNIPVVGKRGVEMQPRGGKPTLPPRPFDRVIDEPPKIESEAEPVRDRGRVIIEDDSIIVVPAVYFEHGTATLVAGTSFILDDIAQTFRQHPEFDVVAEYGHTDDTEPASLSDQRAKVVRDELIRRNVDAERLIAKGWGTRYPIDAAKTPEARAKNRRVDFHILVAGGEATGVEPTIDLAGIVRNGKAVPRALPYGGDFLAIDSLLAQKKNDDAKKKAFEWVDRDSTDKLAWIALGRVYVALGDMKEAARAYGSLLDLAESAEHRRAAAGFLESVGAHTLALRAYAQAAEDRPEQINSLRLHAWSLARNGMVDAAFSRILAAAGKTFDATRFPGHRNVFARDVGLIAAMAARDKSKAERDEIFRRAKEAGAVGVEERGAWAILTWETDASDLDLVGSSGKPRTALQSADSDVKDGYGPEMLALDPRRPELEVHQIRRGPSGYGIGKVMIVRHDGRGTVAIEDRPFVIMNDRARVVVQPALPTR